MKISAAELSGFQNILENLIPNNLYCERLVEPLKEDFYISIFKQTGAGPKTEYDAHTFPELANFLWERMNVRVLIPVHPNLSVYYIRVDAVRESGYRFFTLKLVKREKRNSCAFDEYKNILGGYFYEPEYKLPNYVKKYLSSPAIQNLMFFINRCNGLKLS